MRAGGVADARRALVLWLPVALYVGVILTLSAQPNLQSPFHFRHSDKLCHILEYGGLGMLLARALRGSLRTRAPVVGALLALMIGMMIGAGDEMFQSLIPGRDSSVYDFLADSTGVTLAQLIYLFFARD